MRVEISEVIDLVSLQLGRAEISASHRFMQDLGTESFEIMNLIAAAEEAFAVEISEEEIAGIRCVADLHQLICSKAGLKKNRMSNAENE